MVGNLFRMLTWKELTSALHGNISTDVNTRCIKRQCTKEMTLKYVFQTYNMSVSSYIDSALHQGPLIGILPNCPAVQTGGWGGGSDSCWHT